MKVTSYRKTPNRGTKELSRIGAGSGDAPCSDFTGWKKPSNDGMSEGMGV